MFLCVCVYISLKSMLFMNMMENGMCLCALAFGFLSYKSNFFCKPYSLCSSSSGFEEFFV